MPESIALSVPSLKGKEWEYIKECLDTEWVSSAGKYVNKFEEGISDFTGARYAIACVNGTSALQIALRLAGVSPNDEVIVPTITFIAPINVVKYLNAEPIFMDCDKFYNIDVGKTIEFIQEETDFKDGFTYNKRSSRKITAIIPVNVFGNAVDLEKLIEVCRERNIKIVEDATESLGTVYNRGSYKGRHAGTISDLGCLSFNGNKIITAGGGGMILTNDAWYAKKAKYLTTQAKDDEVRSIHNEIGYNFRLTNIQSALGVAQLEQLPQYVRTKKSNYELYKKAIDDIQGLHLAEVPDYADNNYWMYALQVQGDVYGKSRDALVQFLGDKGIQTRPLWYPNHCQKPYKNNQSYRIECANQMFEKTLNIPCSVNLGRSQMDFVCSKLKEGGFKP